MKRLYLLILLFCFFRNSHAQDTDASCLLILGIAQDGGYPHAGCNKNCCSLAWQHDSLKRFVVSFALVDYSFEATPDITFQLQYFKSLTNGLYNYLPDGVFITHAHIGHYTGLMQFGKEVMSTNKLPVYVLPRMKEFLETSGPWSQLVKMKNIALHPLHQDSALTLPGKIRVETFRVPHRDEYSETAGFKIFTGNKKILFIPDIDKWEKWSRSIIEEVKSADVALLDGTFYEGNELPGRKISEVPHPLVKETIGLFKNESPGDKSKIFFIHLNHTNPLLWNHAVKVELNEQGFNVAEQGQRF
jgi:pyrroloquinoline quinone biosynthesis protein B